MCPHMRSLLLPLACCSNPSRLSQCSAPPCLRAPSAVGHCHCVCLHLHCVAKHSPSPIFPLLFVCSFLTDPPLSVHVQLCFWMLVLRTRVCSKQQYAPSQGILFQAACTRIGATCSASFSQHCMFVQEHPS